MFQLIASVLPLLFAFFIVKWLLIPAYKHKNLPPSPSKLPILGNFHQLGLYPHRSLRSLAQSYGPLMSLKLGSLPVVIASSADAACEIMKTHDLIFASRPKFRIYEKLLYGCQDVSTSPYSEYWRQMRSICVLQLLSNKMVQSFRSVREDETEILMNKIQGFCSNSSPVNLSDMLATCTNDIICRVALGRKYDVGKGGRKFKDLLADFMLLIGSFDVGEFIPCLRWVSVVTGFNAKVDKVAKEFDQFLDGVVEEHIDEAKRRGKIDGIGESKDFVDVLLEIQNDKTLGFSISRDSIKAIILDMFVGGTETSYAVIEWAMSELLRHPRIMKELQKEVREVGRGKQVITEVDLEKMHFLKAVVKETLRLHPSIPLLPPRISSQDVKIKGYDIPAGTIVFTNGWAIARDPRTWEEAEEFKPERFLNSNIDFKGQDFEYIPFGAGRRGCPGISFAMSVDALVLANLVNKFDWALPAGKNLDMTECQGLTIHREVPLLAIATPTFA